MTTVRTIYVTAAKRIYSLNNIFNKQYFTYDTSFSSWIADA